jgi:PKD repeat protein
MNCFRWLTLFFFLYFSDLLVGQNGLPVYFAHGKETFPLNFEQARLQKPATDELTEGKYLRYVQAAQIPSVEQRNTLERLGITFIHYIDQNAYLISIPESFDLGELQTISATSLVMPQTAWKMHRNLKERPFGKWAVSDNGVTIILQLVPHLTIDQGARVLEEKGIKILEKGITDGYLKVQIKEELIETIAALPSILWMEQEAAPAEKEDNQGRSYHRANQVDSDHPLGRKYNGTGVKTLVRDDGALGPHIDFEGRLYNQSGVSDPLSGTHGDGVGGIIGGAGNLDPTKKGMAAGADVYVVNYTSGFQDNTMNLVINQDVTVTNSSYSNGCNDGYTTATVTVDNQVYSNPKLMHVFSAGNSNGSDCDYGAGDQWGNITGGHKMGKNVIATANLDANGSLASSSSRGPANDGRMKPDIAAHGAGQNSTDPENAYQVFGGTSAAAPGIAGCMAQLIHAYKSIHNVSQAPAALLKAAMLNTANDLGNTGPDFKYGWGHVNNFRALRLLEQNRHLNGSVPQGSTMEFPLTIPAGQAQAKVMLYWADPPGTTSAAKALVNDLDITLVDPTGAVIRPWKLNPTPNPVILDTPAGRGRDSLNNAEQVVVVNPVAGNYTIRVNGFSVPMGPQNFYVCWDFLDNGVHLVYPAGGEGLVPGTVEKIRWDAFGSGTSSFTLKYSTNGGSTYSNITTVTNADRTYDWTVPNVVSGNVKFAITRGTFSDTTDYPFTICPLPTNLNISQICPDSATITWTKIPNNNTLSYDVFQLGDKYMDYVATSVPGASALRIPVSTTPNEEAWFAIRASDGNGLKGRRTLAKQHTGGLLNCSQPIDLALQNIISPANTNLFGCEPSPLTVSVSVFNQGTQAVSGAKVQYRWGTQMPVIENLPTMVPGQLLEYTFTTPLIPDQNGSFTLETTVLGAIGEVSLADNQKISTFNVNVVAVNQPFDENFEAAVALPFGWTIENPDNGISWTKYNNPVVGSDGQMTQAFWVDHFSYGTLNQLDYLYLPPFHLEETQFDLPFLEFDYTHSMYNASYTDGLRVELIPDCGNAPNPIVLWELIDPALADTVTTNEYYPTWAGQWNKVVIPLETYKGQNFLLRLVALNGYGNSTFLDNVNIKNYIRPTASIQGAGTACTQEAASFTASPSSGDNPVYAWNFGSGATPPTASGLGPHEVNFANTGIQQIQLIVTNPYGADTSDLEVAVGQPPATSFTYSGTLTNYQFTSSVSGSTSLLWDFGDGTTSTDPQPAHAFPTDGSYLVQLTATNPCGESVFSEEITVVTLPSANFSANVTSGCAPLTVQFTQNASANTTGFEWTFPGGNPATSTDPNPVVVYGQGGLYTASFRVFNSAGYSQPVVQAISINEAPSATFSFATNDLEVQLTNSSTGATSYLWDFGDGNTSTEVSPSHVFGTDGVYEVQLTATNECSSNTSTQMVNVSTLPFASFSVSSSSGCAPFTVSFTNSSSANATGFFWEFIGGTPSSSTDPNPVVIYENPGVFSVSLTATNGVGANVQSMPNLIQVKDGPTASFEALANENLVNFTNISQNATSYLWDFGDGNTSSAENPDHLYAADGFYTVALTAINDCGSVTYTAQIQIVTPLIAGFTAPITEGCLPLEVQFQNQSTANATGFLWSLPGANTEVSEEQHPVVSYNSPGVFPVTLTAYNENDTVTITQPDFVVVADVPSGVAFTSSATGLSVQFFNTGTNVSGLVWDFGDGTTFEGENPTHTYAVPGTYTVTLTASNPCGNVVFSSIVTLVSGVIDPGSPVLQMTVSPNPTAGELTISIRGITGERVLLDWFNPLGQLLWSEEVKSAGSFWSKNYNIQSLPGGSYWIRVRTLEGAGVIKLEKN